MLHISVCIALDVHACAWATATHTHIHSNTHTHTSPVTSLYKRQTSIGDAFNFAWILQHRTRPSSSDNLPTQYIRLQSKRGVLGATLCVFERVCVGVRVKWTPSGIPSVHLRGWWSMHAKVSSSKYTHSRCFRSWATWFYDIHALSSLIGWWVPFRVRANSNQHTHSHTASAG